MIVDISTQIQMILSCVQLALYGFLMSFSVYKMLIALKNQAKFLLLFYIFAFLDSSLYAAMMVYQIIQLVQHQQIELVILIMINVYSIILEACLLFLLSFYWKETQTLLRGSGIQYQQSALNVANQLKVKAIILALWFGMYTAYMIATLVQHNYQTDINQNLFYYAGQGISTLLLIWSNFSQLINAKHLSSTLKRFQSLISFSMNKTKFRCIYWMATGLNFIRLAYLIAITILLRVFTQSTRVQWLAMIIYTISAIIPLAIYLYSFQINQKKKNEINSFSSGNSQRQFKNGSGLYQPPNINVSYTDRKKKSKKSRESFNQTQLSNSYQNRQAI